ncbi:hypothetical protein JCM3774_004658 [Rhodotorula dairenensis]
MHWKQARVEKQAEQAEILRNVRDLLQREEVAITGELASAIRSADSAQIVQNIKQRKPGWTATSVMRVYIEAASKAHERLNVLTEIMFVDALKKAEALDAEFEKTGKVTGLLHGVPVSLKDMLDVEGYDTTLGFTHKRNQPAAKDASLVSLIRKAGGIPFLKSTVPQTMLSFECSTALFGTSLNPYDPRRTPGGSSGGEGGLIGSDSSVVGIGSDIGGSVRIPAHFSGCYALKPSAGRFTNFGIQQCNPGFEGVKSAMGPMGRSVADLELMARVALDGAPELAATQTNLLPVPYRDVKLPDRPLRFGYFLHDGFCAASPACERAVMETVEALRKAGHEVIEFEPTPGKSAIGSGHTRDSFLCARLTATCRSAAAESLEYFIALASAGCYEILLSFLKDDPAEAFLSMATSSGRSHNLSRWLMSVYCRYIVGDEHAARLLDANGGKTVNDVQRWMDRRNQYVYKTRKLLWEEHTFDAVICPTQATPALKHGETKDHGALIMRTVQWNIVDSTVGQIPVTFVDPARDGLTDEWHERRRTHNGSKIFEQRVYGPGGIYDAKDMAGLPVGVQLVGRQWDEERVIELMKVVDEALGPRGFAPGDFAKRETASEKVY